MPPISISSGNFTLNSTLNSAIKPDEHQAKRKGTDAFHIAIVGDFSGRGSRGELDINSLSSRKVIEVDRDNLEEIFSRLNVRLRIPLSETELEFQEFDSLHPDYLLENLDLF